MESLLWRVFNIQLILETSFRYDTESIVLIGNKYNLLTRKFH